MVYELQSIAGGAAEKVKLVKLVEVSLQLHTFLSLSLARSLAHSLTLSQVTHSTHTHTHTHTLIRHSTTGPAERVPQPNADGSGACVSGCRARIRAQQSTLAAFARTFCRESIRNGADAARGEGEDSPQCKRSKCHIPTAMWHLLRLPTAGADSTCGKSERADWNGANAAGQGFPRLNA